MRMAPLVSVLIPAYNAAPWLAETIESVLAQTWPRLEIIIVDDGSRDSTLKAARRFESTRVKVITQENQGAAAARNRAFSICEGDYIQWLDADDLLAPDKIASQMDAVDRGAGPRVLLSSAWGSFMYRSHKADFEATPLWCDLSPAEWLLRKMGLNLHMQTATWLVSRELTEAAGAWNTQLHSDDDGEYFSRVLLKSERIRFVPEAKVLYRRLGTESLSYIGRSERKMESMFLGMQLQIGYVRSLEDSERVREACVSYLQNWMPVFYPDRLDIVERAAQLAVTLGAHLEVPPRLRWKYAWIERGFGWPLAKRAQLFMPRLKSSMFRFWDRVCHSLRVNIFRPAGDPSASRHWN